MSGNMTINGRTLTPLPSTSQPTTSQPPTSLPPNTTVTINGETIKAQRIMRLTSDRNAVSQSIRNNGIDELVIHQNGHDYLVAGTGMNLNQLKKKQLPDIRLNGQPAHYIDHDDEINSAMQGAMQGVRNGWRDLADTTIGATRTAVGTLGATGSFAVVGSAVGGSIYFAMRHGAGSAAASQGAKHMTQAATKSLLSSGLTTMKVIGIAALAGAAVVTVAGAVRGAADTSNSQANWGSLSHLTNGSGASAAPTNPYPGPPGFNRPSPASPSPQPAAPTPIRIEPILDRIR